MTLQIAIEDDWKIVDCEGSKINIGGVWKDLDCEDEAEDGGAGAAQIIYFPGIWHSTTTGSGGWGGVLCNCLESDGIFLDDAETPDEIAPGGNITLTISGGCPPYNWSTSNVGYSLDHATTSGYTNTLNSVGGTCGVHYEPYAQIGVTDVCGSGVEIVIRNTGGTWGTKDYTMTTTGFQNDGCGGCGPGSCANCGNDCRPGNYGVKNIYSGEHRWRFEVYNCVCGGECCGQDWTYAPGQEIPPCGTYYECAEALLTACVGGDCGAYPCNGLAKPAFGSVTHYTWHC